MISALVTSTFFLISYLYYHAHVGSVHYPGTGFLRPIYFSILISHTLLAILVPPLAVITLTRGLKNRIVQHKKIARLTLPIWLYVSLTGVIIYLMLYQF